MKVLLSWRSRDYKKSYLTLILDTNGFTCFRRAAAAEASTAVKVLGAFLPLDCVLFEKSESPEKLHRWGYILEEHTKYDFHWREEICSDMLIVDYNTNSGHIWIQKS